MASRWLFLSLVTSIALLSGGCAVSTTSPSGDTSVSTASLLDQVTVLSVRKSNGTELGRLASDGTFVVTEQAAVLVDETLDVDVAHSMSDASWDASKLTFYVSACLGVTEDTFIPYWCAIYHPPTRSSASLNLKLRLAPSQSMPNRTYFLRAFVTEDGLGKGSGFPLTPRDVPLSSIPVRIYSSRVVPLEMSIGS